MPVLKREGGHFCLRERRKWRIMVEDDFSGERMMSMKMVVLDGYTLNPGDLDWQVLAPFGALSV